MSQTFNSPQDVYNYAADEQLAHTKFVLEFREKLPPHKLKGACRAILREQIENTQKQIDDLFAEYERMSKQGIAFHQKVRAVPPQKIQRLEHGMDFLKRVLNDFEVNDPIDFLGLHDKHWIQKRGLSNYLKHNLLQIITTDQTWN